MRGRSRSVQRGGAALALLALWLQLVLSFGHVHPEDFFPPAAFTPALAPHAAGTPAPAAPAKPAVPTHDDCAICISVAMVGASALPAPVLPPPPPPAFVRPSFPPLVAQAFAGTPRHHFRARAPPFI